MDIPVKVDGAGEGIYTTIPLGILLTQELIVTVCSTDTAVIGDFAACRVKGFSTRKKMRFVYQLLYRAATMYQQELRLIDRRRQAIEKNLAGELKDSDLMELHGLESTLVYFATSLRANATVLDRLTRYKRLEQYPDDRELLDDVPLTPIRAKAKVYIIDRAEQLRANSANALLKTLEEPPEGVMFILLGTSADVMLPTIVSRCQCVPFRLVSPAVAAHAVSRATGQDPARCRMAVAVAGSPTRGIEFLKSAERQDARRQMVRAIDSLIAADEADVLSRAKSLIVAVKAPLAEVKSTQEKVLEQNADYLSRGALKQLEDRNKRELNARERSGIMEALASARTLMRDVLLTLQDEAADVVNEDVRDTIGRLAAATNVAGATRALEAVATAERNIARNVTPQLAIEVMLFDIRKALKCR